MPLWYVSKAMEFQIHYVALLDRKYVAELMNQTTKLYGASVDMVRGRINVTGARIRSPMCRT